MKRPAHLTRNSAYLAAALIAATAFGVGWRYYDAISPTHSAGGAATTSASNTAVLGSNGPGTASSQVAPVFPRAPSPRGVEAEIAALPHGAALALWPQDGHVYAARYSPASGWSPAQALEAIRGEVHDLEIAASEGGAAMAVWRHTLGEIESLRFARWQADAGWGAPDVIPGVLPKRLNSGVRAKLMLDEAGNATLQWPSGFGGTSAQVTRYEANRGWSMPQDVAAR